MFKRSKHSTYKVLAKYGIPKVWYWFSGIALAYLVVYSYLESVDSPAFRLITSSIAPLISSVAENLGGVAHIVEEVELIGIASRGAYIQHVMVISYLLGLISSSVNLLLYKRVWEIVQVSENRQIISKSYYISIPACISFFAVIFYFYHYGIDINPSVIRGFKPHVNNYEIVFWCVSSIYMIQAVVTNLLLNVCSVYVEFQIRRSGEVI